MQSRATATSQLGMGRRKEGRERVVWGKRDAVVRPSRALDTEYAVQMAGTTSNRGGAASNSTYTCSPTAMDRDVDVDVAWNAGCLLACFSEWQGSASHNKVR